MTGYEVSEHGYGRPVVRRGPMQGCLNWPQHTWTRINQRPLGINRATELAQSRPHHAVVVIWMTAEKVFDNGKEPFLPEGWYPERATTSAA